MNIDHFIALLQTFILPSWLGGKTAVFDASGSLAGDNERNPRLRAPFHRRFPAMIVDNVLWMHLVLIAANITGVILCILRACYPSVDNNPLSRSEYLFVRLGWPPLLWFVFTLICAGPVSYAIFPPLMPAREEMLDRDLMTGIAYPKLAARRLKWSWNTVGYEYYFTIAVLYTVAMWVAARSSPVP